MNWLYKLLSAAALAQTAYCQAQASQIHTVAGHVSSVDGPVEGFSAMLLSPADSTIYVGDYFPADEFSLKTEILPALLHIYSPGYRDTTLTVEPGTGRIDVTLQPHALSLHDVRVT